MGLAILGRANAIILLLPLGGRGLARAASPRSCWCVAAALTVVPWTIRNAIVLDHFVPVSTQFGSALAGTYNSEARADKENPASWRTLKRVDDYQPIFSQRPHDQRGGAREASCATASLEFIKEHPAYVVTVAFWTTRRMLDLAGMDWSIHTASTISAGRAGRRSRAWSASGSSPCWR